MFDVGFFELVVIATIGLFVIGPERLPGAIRSVALWVGRVKYFISETRSEFEKQIGADDIRRELHNEQVMRSLEALKQSKQELEASIQNSVKEPQNTILPNDDYYEELPDFYDHDENGVAVTGNNASKPRDAGAPQTNVAKQHPPPAATANDQQGEAAAPQANAPAPAPHSSSPAAGDPQNKDNSASTTQ